MARWYAEAVVAERIDSCHREWQGCRRFLDMIERAETDPRCEWTYEPDYVIDVCDFISKLPHVKGFEGKVVLEPVQMWWLANIFGFREKHTGLRWMRQVSIYIPRKNGKSLLSAGIALYCTTCEGEIGPECVISAGSEEQAQKVYKPIRDMLTLEPELRFQFQIADTRDGIEIKRNNGTIIPVAAIGKNNDGWNPHIVVAEELHAQKQEVVSVLATAQGARKQPMFLSISTAGRNPEGPAYDDWKQCLAMLDGRLSAPHSVAIMYAPDKDDDKHLFDDRVVEKLNPLWGVSLNPTAMENERRRARMSPSDLNEYKRTRINIWSRAAGNLFSVEAWDACGDPLLDLNAFRGYPMYVGLDLASRSDLNAACFMICVDDCLYMIGKYWIGRNVRRLKDDRWADSFLQWAREGFLELTDLHDGTFADYKAILHLVLGMLEGHNVIGIGLDDYQANYLASELEEAGYPCFIVQKNAKSLTPATDDLIGRHNNPKMLQHDGSPVTAWCAGNVVGYWDSNDNILPKKEKKNSEASIDGVDAAVIANAIRLEQEAGTLGMSDKAKAKVNPYLHRGLAGRDNGTRHPGSVDQSRTDS